MRYAVTFYTKSGCHLCDDARSMLQWLAKEFSIAVAEVDITRDAEVYERFKELIPVIEIEGRVRLGGRFTQEDLRCAILETVVENGNADHR